MGSIPDRPTDAPLDEDFFSGAARITDGRLRDYLNAVEARVAAVFGSLPVDPLTDTYRVFVDAALGSDDAEVEGTASDPLASIVEAERRAHLLVDDREIEIVVAPHPGAGYSWPTWRARSFLDNRSIWVRFSDYSTIDSGTVQAGSSTSVLVSEGGLTPDALEDGSHVHVLDGAAAGDRRTIRENGATNVEPHAFFTADPTGSAYEILAPDPGNKILLTTDEPMAIGFGVGEEVPLGNVDRSPGLRIVNAIVETSGGSSVLAADARISFFGCRFSSTDAFHNYGGSGQILFGRAAWNRVDAPMSLSLPSTAWVGWGVSFVGGHFPIWTGAVPFVSGYLNAPRWVQFGGVAELTGHLRGPLRVIGENNTIDTSIPRCAFGSIAPFLTPRRCFGKITTAVGGFRAVDVQQGAYVVLGDDTEIESASTDLIRGKNGARIRANGDINFTGASGANGLVLAEDSRFTISGAGSLTIVGSIAGDEVVVDGLVSTFAELASSGDTVSGSRARWLASQAVSGNQVTLSIRGAVLAVEAVAGSSTGVKQVQNSASPAAGFCRVSYDAQGFATVTFNATDAVTSADIHVRPEGGSIARVF